jgi:hypothetical protein
MMIRNQVYIIMTIVLLLVSTSVSAKTPTGFEPVQLSQYDWLYYQSATLPETYWRAWVEETIPGERNRVHFQVKGSFTWTEVYFVDLVLGTCMVETNTLPKTCWVEHGIAVLSSSQSNKEFQRLVRPLRLPFISK